MACTLWAAGTLSKDASDAEGGGESDLEVSETEALDDSSSVDKHRLGDEPTQVLGVRGEDNFAGADAGAFAEEVLGTNSRDFTENGLL